KLRVGALLREHRVKTPRELSRWSKPWVIFARGTTQLSEQARWIINQVLDQVIELDRRIAEAHERLCVATAGDTIVAKLMEQEGVGEVTAWGMRAFIG